MDMFALQTIKYVCSLWPYHRQAEASHDKKKYQLGGKIVTWILCNFLSFCPTANTNESGLAVRVERHSFKDVGGVLAREMSQDTQICHVILKDAYSFPQCQVGDIVIGLGENITYF